MPYSCIRILMSNDSIKQRQETIEVLIRNFGEQKKLINTFSSCVNSLSHINCKESHQQEIEPKVSVFSHYKNYFETYFFVQKGV